MQNSLKPNLMHTINKKIIKGGLIATYSGRTPGITCSAAFAIWLAMNIWNNPICLVFESDKVLELT